jgi:hypothetical protein
MQMLYEQGKLIYAGPFLDNWGGTAILNASSEQEVEQIVANESATLSRLCSRDTSLAFVVRLQSRPLVVQQDNKSSLQWKLGSFMTGSAADTPEDVVRTKGVQDHDAGLFTKVIFWRARRRYGHVPLSTRIRANDSKLLGLAELMSRYTSARGTLPPKLKELAQLKVATMVGCPF